MTPPSGAGKGTTGGNSAGGSKSGGSKSTGETRAAAAALHRGQADGALPGGLLPLVLVAAVADNGVIGRGGAMPWRLKTDLKRFRALTLGHPVVMGRRTFLALGGKPLAGRTNIVVSRDPGFAAPGTVVAPTLHDALAAAHGDALRRGAAAIMVGGGGGIYAATIAIAERLEITRVHDTPEGDTVFPAIDRGRWRETARHDYPATPDDDASFTALTYERRRD